MKCESCGAEIPPGALRCEFCDTSIRPPGEASRQCVFAQVKQSSQYARRDRPERHAALPKYGGLAKVAPVVFFVVFIGIGVFMTIVTLGMAGVVGLAGMSSAGPLGGGVSLAPLAMSVCPMAFVALGVFLLVQFFKKFQEFQRSPILARAAVVVAKRTAVSGGSGDSSATTSYHLTAEFEDGTRAEFQPIRADLYGRVAEGDAGVLFTRAAVALDFDRVSTGG